MIVQPHAQLVFIAARDKTIKRVGTLSAGWPERSDVAITTRKGSGLADALTLATNDLIKSGAYAKILDRWQLSEEALPESRTNPPGLPKADRSNKCGGRQYPQAQALRVLFCPSALGGKGVK